MKNNLSKTNILVFLVILVHAFNILTAQTGTGYNYMPWYVAVTGGGNMPDSTNRYTCNCDGTGAVYATGCLQDSMDSAAAQHKPLLIPYTAGYFKIDSTLKVNCSVIVIGGMPTIKQTADVVVFSLSNNMTGWIYNMHCIGTYGAPDQPTEQAHIIDIGGVNGVTISNNFLENAMGDIISDNAQGGGADTARNVLITNNTLKNCMRSVFSLYWISNRWAIMNNLFYYITGWANVIEIEPLEAKCYISNIEVGYNNIQSSGAKSNYYSNIMDVTNYNDKTPGGGVVGHHNWGKWGVPFGRSKGWTPATVFKNSGTAPQSEYRIAKTIQLSGNGDWDYLSVDEINQKLFVSHGLQVNVVDLKTGKEIAVIPETNGAHGIAISNDLNKAFISCGIDSSVSVVDLTNFKLLAKVKVTGKNPDAILYDQFSKKVFTFNYGSSNATVIDANSLKIIATIPLTGKPEFAQTDGKGKIFVNIEDKSSLTIINAVALKTDLTWSIAPGEEPTGLAYDKVNNRLFSVCGNKLMVVSDAASGKVITSSPIGAECDGVAFDPTTKHIFASNGDGTMTVIQQVSDDQYKVLETFPTLAGVRTISVDKTTHHIYVSGVEYEPGTGRRSVKPNTFKVLDIEPVK